MPVNIGQDGATSSYNIIRISKRYLSTVLTANTGSLSDIHIELAIQYLIIRSIANRI